MAKKLWYPRENGMAIIEVNLDGLEQLFDKRDPNPFRNKDLDEDFVEYVVSSAQEIGLSSVGKIRLVVGSEITDQDKKIVHQAVYEYFVYRADITGKNIKKMLKIGLKALFIGLLFLSVSIFASDYIGKMSDGDFKTKFVMEGLLLIGWVSMWKPINTFLYDWWPMKALQNLYLHLATKTEIEVLGFNR